MNFHISYLGLPSRATILLPDENQFLLVKSRIGRCGTYDLDIISQVLTDMKEIEENNLSEREMFLLRGMYVDNKVGGISIYVDLLHDRQQQPSLSTEEIKGKLHDGYSWYEGQIIDVYPEVISEYIGSDSFDSLNDKYYERVYAAFNWVYPRRSSPFGGL